MRLWMMMRGWNCRRVFLVIHAYGHIGMSLLRGHGAVGGRALIEIGSDGAGMHDEYVSLTTAYT